MRRLRIIIALVIILALSVGASSFGRNFYRSLSRRLGKDRQTYSHLTDEEFANFREVSIVGIARGKLYRSSSPLDTWGNRNIIADNAAGKAGIRTFINLADTYKVMREREGFTNTYYSTQKAICLNMSPKYRTERFRNGLARGVKFMAENEPPYLVHCTLGRDRTGLVCLVIELLAGASMNEAVNDYMISYYNYFGIEKGSREYEFVVNNEIIPFIAYIAGVKIADVNRINLSDAAERYLLRVGVGASEISSLVQKLSH